MLLQSDGEPAMIALKDEIRVQAVDLELILRESIVGDHQLKETKRTAEATDSGARGEKREADPGGEHGGGSNEGIELIVPDGEFAFWDDVHGGWLDKEGVLAARRLELEYMHRHRIYERVGMPVSAEVDH
eukprot:1948347-Amphidinium_carterae.1